MHSDHGLAAQIVRLPVLADPQAAPARVAEWLAEIAGTVDGEALARIFAEYPKFAELTAGLAEFAPHLWDHLRADAGRAVRLLTRDPALHLDALLTQSTLAIAASDDATIVMRHLRALKAEAALLIALCDIGGAWPIMRVTQALTRLADCAVGSAVCYLLADATRRGRFVPVDPGRPDVGSGYIVLAMGKMGAGELNYSSDIDLIVFFDAAAPLRNAEASTFFVRMTQRLVKLLSERTQDGYVFRTDLRLRPDPASTPLAVSARVQSVDLGSLRHLRLFVAAESALPERAARHDGDRHAEEEAGCGDHHGCEREPLVAAAHPSGDERDEDRGEDQAERVPGERDQADEDRERREETGNRLRRPGASALVADVRHRRLPSARATA